MGLNSKIKIETIEDEIRNQGFNLEIKNTSINITSPSGIWMIIHRARFEKEVIYQIDSFSFHAYMGLNDLVRDWRDVDSMKDYIASILLPLLKHAGGPANVNKEQAVKWVEEVIKKRLPAYDFDESRTIYSKVELLTGDVVECKDTQPVFSFDHNGHSFGICLTGSFIDLIEIKNDTNALYKFPWHSFCPIYKTGMDYVETTVNNFLDYVENCF